MLSFVVDGSISLDVPAGIVWTGAVLAIAVLIAFYVLRSIGLYALAKRQKIANAFLAWIPLVWMYTACKIIGKIKIFGKTFEKLAVIFCVIFAVAELLTFVQNFMVYFPIVGNYLAGREIVIAGNADFLKEGYVAWTDGIYYNDANFVNPYGDSIFTVNKILNVIYYVSMIFDLASIFVVVTVYINLFRKFWPQHYVLASVLSILLGLFAPFVFAIRKKEPVDYMEYIRSRYNYYNPYGPYGGPGPYGRGNPYGPYGNNVHAQPPEHPFEEFAEKGEVDPGDPFGEFSDKNDNGKDER